MTSNIELEELRTRVADLEAEMLNIDPEPEVESVAEPSSNDDELVLLRERVFELEAELALLRSSGMEARESSSHGNHVTDEVSADRQCESNGCVNKAAGAYK